MKKLLHLLLCAGLSCYPADSSEQSGISPGQAACPHLSWATTLGTSVALDRSASTPLLWQVSGYYNLSRRWAIGAGIALRGKLKLLLNAGYEFQELERLKGYSDDLFPSNSRNA